MSKRMDEMQMSMNLKAIRISWVVTLLCLLGWVLYDWVWQNNFNALAVIIMSIQIIVYWGTQIILNQKIGNDAE